MAARYGGKPCEGNSSEAGAGVSSPPASQSHPESEWSLSGQEQDRTYIQTASTLAYPGHKEQP